MWEWWFCSNIDVIVGLLEFDFGVGFEYNEGKVWFWKFVFMFWLFEVCVFCNGVCICICDVFCEGCNEKYFLNGGEFELFDCWKFDCVVLFLGNWLVNFEFLEILMLWIFCCGGGKCGFCRENFRLLLVVVFWGFNEGFFIVFFCWFVGLKEFLLF